MGINIINLNNKRPGKTIGAIDESHLMGTPFPAKITGAAVLGQPVLLSALTTSLPIVVPATAATTSQPYAILSYDNVHGDADANELVQVAGFGCTVFVKAAANINAGSRLSYNYTDNGYIPFVTGAIAIGYSVETVLSGSIFRMVVTCPYYNMQTTPQTGVYEVTKTMTADAWDEDLINETYYTTGDLSNTTIGGDFVGNFIDTYGNTVDLDYEISGEIVTVTSASRRAGIISIMG